MLNRVIINAGEEMMSVGERIDKDKTAASGASGASGAI
jgi:hypothetical protein